MVILAVTFGAWAEELPLAQDWDYAPAMKAVAAKFHGREGVVLHVGDSITYANPYGGWARYGKGHSDADAAALKWMHAGARDDTDGWYLAAFDHPDGGRSYTAVSGIRSDEMLAGGKAHAPPLAELLDRYKPRMVVLMLGTNDASAGRPVDAYRQDTTAAIGLMLDRGIIPIVSTIPPHPHATDLAKAYNDALRQLARELKIPLIDYEREILQRRPNDWNGTLLAKDDVHPSAARDGADPAAEPTAENLRNSGYLLRGWLSVKKIEEVKHAVLDDGPPAAAATQRTSNAQGRTIVPDSTGAQSATSGDALRLPVTRDTWFSNVGDQSDGSNGGSSQLKLKSIQEMSLIDIDPAPLKGRVIRAATLHLHGTGSEILRRVTVSTFAAGWVEGTATGYAEQPGSSTFNARQFPDTPWSYPGSDLTSVALGQGGTLWGMADAAAPDAQGWQTVAVDPAVVAARTAGVSEGFLLFDDTGSEWTHNGQSWKLRQFPNRLAHSRESGPRTAPYLTVELGAADHEAPAAPAGLRSDATDLPPGEARVSWLTPPDAGPAGTIGFFVDIDGKPAPRYLIPAARAPGGRVTMHVRDLGLAGGAVRIAVHAVDGAGNVGPDSGISLEVAGGPDAPLPRKALASFAGNGPAPRLGDAEIAVIDALDKVQPVTGQMVPNQADGYLLANHLWSAGEKRIRLQAARNEFVSFQIVVRGPVQGLKPTLRFVGNAAQPQASFSRFRYIPDEGGPMPDPLVPLNGEFAVPAADDHVADQKNGSLFCEVYVPHDAAAGRQQGTLSLTADGSELKLAVDLTIWDFTLADHLSFLPEMNCYDLPDNERAYYRLAHVNRTVLNRVPYHQDGEPSDGCAPRWDGKSLDFAAWDQRFGPYLDGSAFADLPRKAVPLDGFYLPLNENWPSPMAGNYNDDYWADRAFPPAYREAFVSASRQFAEHCDARHWDQTIFECFFNGKNNYKERGWSHGSSPWLLDEPTHFQDFWALRYFGAAFHEGADAAAGDAKMVFRCDISRPQWQRDALDPVLNYNVVAGGAFQQYRRIVIDRKQQFGQIVLVYGGTNNLHQSNVQPVAWSLDAWTEGADGVLPWQTIGEEGSWHKADPFALFYPGGLAGGPVPSIRLKAYLRGEQDVEYLVMLAQLEKQSQLQMGRRVRQAIGLTGERNGTGLAGEDAGLIEFAKLLPQDLWALRVRVAEALDAAHPQPRQQLVDFRVPKREGSGKGGP